MHYKGVVEGDPSSIVAVSVFNDQVMALISSDLGNAVIGPIKGDRENRHVFYDEKDLDRKSGFECGTLDDGLAYTAEQLKEHPQGRDAGDCVKLYIEIDDDIVTEKGGATPATNYVTGLFNQSIVLYNNESINMSINEIFAWTVVLLLDSVGFVILIQTSVNVSAASMVYIQTYLSTAGM